METRAKNKTAHPGTIQKSSQKPRRTKEEVQRDKDAKAKAKQDREEAKQNSINRTAEFERADIVNEDIVDATPRPLFTPKQRRFPQSHKNSPLTSFADTSDIEIESQADGPEDTPFIPGSADDAVDVGVDLDDTADAPPPPAEEKKEKKSKKAKTDAKNQKVEETAGHKRKVVDVEGNAPREPKPKKVKVKMRDQINDATMKIMENEKELEGNRFAKMVDSMGSSGRRVSTATVPSHSPQPEVQAGDGRKLKREGAIADLNLPKKSGKEKEEAIADINTRPDTDNNNFNRYNYLT